MQGASASLASLYSAEDPKLSNVLICAVKSMSMVLDAALHFMLAVQNQL